jgi:hypothetical protein
MSEFISGYYYYKSCKMSLCPRYPINYVPDLIEHNDLIFINLDYFDAFIETLKSSPPKNKFRLVTQNSDRTFTENHFNKVKPYIEHVYAINSIYENPMLSTIPIGFCDKNIRPSKDLLEIKNQNNTKIILLYMNFLIITNFNKRTECFNTFNNKSYVFQEQNISPYDYYKSLSQSKYTVSPEGTGIDCHRIYEALYFDTIPILKTSSMDYFYKNLPVLIVNSWTEIDENYLISNYEYLKKKLDDWKTINKDWNLVQYWIK